MATTELTDVTFDPFVDQGGIVVTVFRTHGCGPCLQFAPVVEAASERHPEVAFGLVDIDTEQALKESFGVDSAPRTVVWRDGLPVFAQSGLLVSRALDELVENVRGLDMDDVRRDLEAQGLQSTT